MSFDDDVREIPEVVRPDALASFDAFVSSVRARLEAGRVEYGDRSFTRPPEELLTELQQEALDLAGWGFILFARLEAARKKASELSQRADYSPMFPYEGSKG